MSVSMRFDRCVRLIQFLDSVEREHLIKRLILARVSLTVLNEDILSMILTHLNGDDRIALLTALQPINVPSLTPYISRYPILAVAFCVERCHSKLCKHLLAMAERILYYHNEVGHFNRRGKHTIYIACNWSPFKGKKIESLANITALRVPPYVRVDLSSRTIRHMTIGNLTRYTPVLRLVAYRCIQHNEEGFCVRLHGVCTRISKHPIHVEECNLYETCEKNASSLLQKQVFRKMMSSFL